MAEHDYIAEREKIVPKLAVEQEKSSFSGKDFIKEWKHLMESETERNLINQALYQKHPIISLKCGTCSEDMFTITGPLHLLEQLNGVSRPVCLSCMKKRPRGTAFYAIEIRVLVQKPQMTSDGTIIETNIEREVRREGRDDRVYPH